jgi:hypothetical protein
VKVKRYLSIKDRKCMGFARHTCIIRDIGGQPLILGIIDGTIKIQINENLLHSRECIIKKRDDYTYYLMIIDLEVYKWVINNATQLILRNFFENLRHFNELKMETFEMGDDKTSSLKITAVVMNNNEMKQGTGNNMAMKMTQATGDSMAMEYTNSDQRFNPSNPYLVCVSS